jgi:hypothetical protein
MLEGTAIPDAAIEIETAAIDFRGWNRQLHQGGQGRQYVDGLHG